ncbi:MAG TPA: hypothetical protein VK338_05820 [Candidatus Nitrosocosmicus sp.]|nr:hypothetical protein [Candidatus Nitrosocosmicus sp.]
MKNSRILLIIGAIVVVTTSAFFVANNKAMKPAEPKKMTAEPTQTTASESKEMAFKDFLNVDTSEKCTFEDTQNNTITKGTIYTTKGKVRGDITTTVDGKATVSHMVIEPTQMHIWVDGQKQGFKTTIDTETLEKAKQDAQNMQMNVNQTYKYTCTPSKVDNAMFSLPTGIEFIDFSGIMPQISVTGSAQATLTPGDPKESPCAACNGMSGDEKVQCMSANNCPTH